MTTDDGDRTARNSFAPTAKGGVVWQGMAAPWLDAAASDFSELRAALK